MQIIPYCFVYWYTTAQKFGVGHFYVFIFNIFEKSHAHQKHIKSNIVKYYHNLKK